MLQQKSRFVLSPRVHDNNIIMFRVFCMTLQVRAKTAAHDGEWSNVIQFGRSTLRYRYWYIDMDFFSEPFGSPCPDPRPDASTTEGM